MKNALMRATVRILCVVYTPCTSQKLQYLERKFVEVFKHKCDLYRNVFLSQMKIRIPSVCLFVFLLLLLLLSCFMRRGKRKGTYSKLEALDLAATCKGGGNGSY